MSEPTRKSDIIESGILDDFIRDVKKAKQGLEKYDEELRKVAQTMKGELDSANKTTIQGMEKVARLQKQAEKQVKAKRANQKTLTTLEREEQNLLKQKAKLEAQVQASTSKTAKEVARLRAEKNKINKATRDEIKQNERSKDAYSRLVDETRDAKNESKRLGARLRELRKEGKDNEKGFKDLEQQYNETTRNAKVLDAELKDLDKTVGDNFRNVGNYESATNKLTGSLKTLAGAAGLGALIGGLGSVTRELSEAENQARLFFDTTEEGTKDIAKEATILAKVFDKDVNEVLRSANVLSRQFGLSGEDSLALLNQGFEKGGDVSGELLENISEYSTQLRLAGLNAEESISVITQSQQQGVFSDKGIDAIKEATLSLREMTPPAQEALEAIGMSADQVQKDIASGTKTYFDVIQDISTRTNEVGENTQAAGMILADVFKGAGEDAGDFIFSLGEMNTSLEQLEDQNKGLEGAIQNITREWYEFVFGVEEGTGAIDKFSGVINFVADNLGTIIKTLGRLAALYLIIKTRQRIINSGILDYAKNLFTANKNQKGLNKSMNDGSKGAGKFGSTLKGIGWAALIGVAIELAVAFYDIASGAAEARRKAKELDDYRADADKKSTEAVSQYNEEYEKRLFNLNEEERILKSKAKTQQEVDEIALEFLEKRRKEAAKQTKLFDTLNQQAQEKIDKDLKSIEVLEKLNVSNGQILDGNEKLAEQLREAGFENAEYNSTWASINVTVDEAIRRKSELTAKVEAARVRQENYNEALEQADKILTTVTNDIAVDSNERENNRDKINAQVKGLKDQNDELERQKLNLKDIDALLNEGQTLEEIEDEEISQENARIQRELNERLTMINDAERAQTLTQEEAQEQRAIMQLEALLEQRKILKQYGRDTVEVDREISALRLEISKEYTSKELEEMDALNKAREEQQKEALKMFNETQKAITAAMSSNIDERISLLDREAQAAKEQQDYLQGLAEQGNIEAGQSITEEREREIAALREKERLEKQKATLELISSALEVFSTSLEEGASPQEALAQTVLTTGALTEFLSGLNFFAEGTDNAPSGLAVVGEEGPEAQFSKSGKFQGILGQKGAEFRNMKGGERILTAPETMDWMRQSALMNQISPIKQDVAGSSYDLIGKKLDNVERAIKNQPSNDWSIEEAAKNVMNLVKTTRQGGDKRVSKYRVKH